jgi:hypothetical protein
LSFLSHDTSQFHLCFIFFFNWTED